MGEFLQKVWDVFEIIMYITYIPLLCLAWSVIKNS